MATDGPAPDFTTSRRGYDRDEVDRHLSTTATTIGRLRDRVSSLEERLRAAEDAAAAARTEAAEAAARAEDAIDTSARADAVPGPDAPARERFAALGEETTRILVAAEESARDMRERAKRRAESEVAAAERAARERVDSATEHATRLVGDAEGRRDQIVQETDSYRERVVSEADQRRDQIVAETDSWRVQTVTETEAQRDQILADAETRRQQIVSETEARRDAVIAEMEARRDALTAELDERVKVREREISRLGNVRTTMLTALRGAVDVTNDAVRTLTDGGDGMPELDDDEDPEPAAAAGAIGLVEDPMPWESADDHGDDAPAGAWSRTEQADEVATTAWSAVDDDAADHDAADADEWSATEDEPSWSRSYTLDQQDEGDDADAAPAVFEGAPGDDGPSDTDRGEMLEVHVDQAAGDDAAVDARSDGTTDELEDIAGLAEIGDLDGLEEHDADTVIALDGDDLAGVDEGEEHDAQVSGSGDRGERHGAAPAALRSALADATSAADLGSLTQADADSSPGLRRERSLASVRPGTLRRLRRGLQDIQNGVLEGVREREDGAAESVLPGNEAADVLAELSRPYLDAAYRAGVTDAAVLTGADAPDAATADDLTVQLASERVGAELVDELTTTLLPSLRAGIDAGEPDASLSERVGEVFRDLKGPIVETVADRHLTGTYGRGTVDEWKARGVERIAWVLGEESRCPENRCRTNSAEGAVAPGEGFPSGDTLPPVHDGCTCALAPATDD